jgi:hypothetical protein
MKTQKEQKNKFLELRAKLLSAVAELDLRGTDRRITDAMCVIEATFDAAVSGKRICARKAAKLGLALSKRVSRASLPQSWSDPI